MRIPLTRYGMPQVLFYPLGLAIIMLLIYIVSGPVMGWPMFSWAIPNFLLFLVFAWMLSFFRDPQRTVPQGENILISPADGTVSAVEVIEDCEYMQGKVQRISIFLSVFNVHINRFPCACKVDDIIYKEGKFINALNDDCAKVNEANNVYATRLQDPQDKFILRQVSGAIARRIVCEARKGDTFQAGQQFGMIKFGSCTEIYIPARDNLKISAKKGDKIRAGLTILGQYV